MKALRFTIVSSMIFALGGLAFGQSDTGERQPVNKGLKASPAGPASEATELPPEGDGKVDTPNGQESKSDQQAEAKSSERAVFVIAPVVMATETGCWATFYDDENFLGNQVTLSGRHTLPDVDFDLKPYAFGGEPDSVAVGPNATLDLYGDEAFTDLDESLAAGSKVANLKQQPFWDDIESVRMRCTQPDQTAE